MFATRNRWTVLAAFAAGLVPMLGESSALAQAVASDPVSAASAVSIPTPAAPQAEILPGGRPGPSGVLQLFRWTEDWSAPPAPGTPLVDRIRHIPLGSSDTYLSLGGEIRAYYTDWQHSALGLRAADDNDPLQLRLRLLADLHIGPHVRAFVEVGDNREFGAQFATLPNRGRLNLQQAFIDLTLPLGNSGSITLRPGRFEMPLGNNKLVSVRDAMNERFTYQGLRATYILHGSLSVDVFAVRPVSLKPGTFNDGPSHVSSFRGVYVSAAKGPFGLGTDAYWYRLDREVAVLGPRSGEDRRNTWGMRAWKRTSNWDLDVEGAYQTGTFGSRDIAAWAVMFESGVTLSKTAMTPRLGLRANVFSGNHDPSGKASGTFVPAFPRFGLISEAAFFNLSNLMDIYPSLTLSPHRDITVTVGPDFLWRNSRADGIYIGATGAAFAAYGSGRFTGTDLNLQANWQATKHLQFTLYETFFSASGSLTSYGGKNGNYLGIQSDFKF
ncbi:alginate export family protein [Sphingomonas sp. PAMC26645]|uniref:alginate export family protein n=1 Tax=Sphingomonas sp. PAMC26645 TaxID=2565555 RepID=UPI001446578F|nr:alginate export family protein [Sphingomonas sp. PAMC26645]